MNPEENILYLHEAAVMVALGSKIQDRHLFMIELAKSFSRFFFYHSDDERKLIGVSINKNKKMFLHFDSGAVVELKSLIADPFYAYIFEVLKWDQPAFGMTLKDIQDIKKHEQAPKG